MAEFRLVESVDVVESWLNSTSWKVCSVASAANDTRRLASDLRRASRRSRSSRSRAAACCSSSVLTAILDPLFSELRKVGVEISCVGVPKLIRSGCLGFKGGISGIGMVGLRIERGAALVGTARD